MRRLIRGVLDPTHVIVLLVEFARHHLVPLLHGFIRSAREDVFGNIFGVDAAVWRRHIPELHRFLYEADVVFWA